MATDTIDPFCANCLPATVSPEALAKLQQQPDVWYLAQILVNLAFQAAQFRGAQDGTAPLQVATVPNQNPDSAVLLQTVVPVPTPGTPVSLGSSNVQSVEIFARKNATTANTGNVYVGFSPNGGQNYRVLTPGQSITLTAPDGQVVSTLGIYIDAATAGDAVVCTAIL